MMTTSSAQQGGRHEQTRKPVSARQQQTVLRKPSRDDIARVALHWIIKTALERNREGELGKMVRDHRQTARRSGIRAGCCAPQDRPVDRAVRRRLGFSGQAASVP
jgi:hypothetical protein